MLANWAPIALLVALACAQSRENKNSTKAEGRFMTCALENEVFAECEQPCEATCTHDPIGCVGYCTNICKCKDGYIRHEGQCVPVDQCPIYNSPRCRNGEEPNGCFMHCTCSTYKATGQCNRICTERIGPAPCTCANGAIPLTEWDMSWTEKPCVTIEECKKMSFEEICAPNEEWTPCADQCPYTCYGKPAWCRQNLLCIPGCECKSGFIRHQGKCIKIETCPNYDPENLKRKAFGAFGGASINSQSSSSSLNNTITAPCQQNSAMSDKCELSCEDLQATVPEKCPEKCYCLPGYARYDEGQCIPKADCPQQYPKMFQALMKKLIG